MVYIDSTIKKGDPGWPELRIGGVTSTDIFLVIRLFRKSFPHQLLKNFALKPNIDGGTLSEQIWTATYY